MIGVMTTKVHFTLTAGQTRSRNAVVLMDGWIWHHLALLPWAKNLARAPTPTKSEVWCMLIQSDNCWQNLTFIFASKQVWVEPGKFFFFFFYMARDYLEQCLRTSVHDVMLMDASNLFTGRCCRQPHLHFIRKPNTPIEQWTKKTKVKVMSRALYHVYTPYK